jgi:hypothetical protein
MSNFDEGFIFSYSELAGWFELVDLTPVIARSEATKQSILVAKLDCFAEPVIGRAFARLVGSQRREEHFHFLA